MDSQIQVLEGLGYGPMSIEGLAATESPRADPGLSMFDLGKWKWALLAAALLGAGFVGWKWWKGHKKAPGLTGLSRRRRKSGGKKRRSKKRGLGAMEVADAATLTGAPKRRKKKGKGGNRGAFARAAKACKGQGGDAFRACMRSKLSA